MKLVDKVTALHKFLRHHSYLYYELNAPEISDARYDFKFKQLKDIEAKHPEFITNDSPTQKIGYKPRC